ncbi:hypothetical protein HYW53_03115 [Candidatus Giovannonibacteria bacterium]|nr:hypothetical protein [Candidatus Giovannonibacteria bacterium]
MLDLNPILALPVYYRYLAILPIAMLEGPMISVASGFLVSFGILNPFLIYAVLVLGDVLPDIAYYFIGRFGKNRKFFINYVSRHDTLARHLALAEKLWRGHPGKTMLFTKLAYGLSTPLLISAGFTNMSPKKFISKAFPVTLGQHLVTMSIGYYLGESYEIASKYLEGAGYLAAGIVLIFALAYLILQKYAARQIRKMEEKDKE